MKAYVYIYILKHIYIYIYILKHIYIYIYIYMAKELPAAASVMRSSSKELGTLVADRV